MSVMAADEGEKIGVNRSMVDMKVDNDGTVTATGNIKD